MPQHPTLSDALNQYLSAYRARRAPATLKGDRFVLSRFVAAMGDIQVRHLRPERVTDWFYGPGGLLDEHQTRDRRRREPVQATTHNFYRARLKSFFTFCQQRGYLRADLLIEVPHMRTVRRERQQPGPLLLLAMLDHAASNRDRAYLAVLMNTGLRANEVLRLRVGDVDLREGNLRVYISKSKQEDLLPVTSDLDGELRVWLTEYAADIGRPLATDDFLFPAASGPRYAWVPDDIGVKKQVIVPSTWVPERALKKAERIVQTAMFALGLPTKGEGSHTIRRAIARHFFDALVSDPKLGYDGALRTVSALLHHTNISTTETYLGLSTEKSRRDKTLRGQPFLTAMISADNVVAFPRNSEPAALYAASE